MKIPTPRKPQTKTDEISGDIRADLGKLNPLKAQELVETWFKTPPGFLSNMFYTYCLDKNNQFFNRRAVTYELPSFALADLIGIYQNAKKAGKNAELKVYMGCNPKFIPGQIMEDEPAFCPFVQCYVFDTKTTPLAYSNSYKLNWRPSSTVSLSNQNYNQDPRLPNKPRSFNLNAGTAADPNNPSHLSPNTAQLFLREWCMAYNDDIEGLFSGIVNGQVARINSFTFLEEDLEAISNLWAEKTSRNLYVHLAVIKPNTRSPFDFHIVVEVGTHSKLSISGTTQEIEDKDEGNFFEFAYPCPPYCIGTGG